MNDLLIWVEKKKTAHQNQATIHQTKSTRPTDAGTAMHHGRSNVRTQRARVAYLLEELEKRQRRAGNAKVRPRIVVKL